jgi:hypothetical protein
MPHHVTQRGNRRERVFHEDGDHALYRDLLKFRKIPVTPYQLHFQLAVPVHLSVSMAGLGRDGPTPQNTKSAAVTLAWLTPSSLIVVPASEPEPNATSAFAPPLMVMALPIEVAS